MDSSDQAGDGFLTVADAAKALGIPLRRAYRLVDKLSPSDKSVTTLTTGRTVATIRLSALSALVEGSRTAIPAQPSLSQFDTVDRAVIERNDNGNELHELRTRVAVLEAEKALLVEERDRWHSHFTDAMRTLEKATATPPRPLPPAPPLPDQAIAVPRPWWSRLLRLRR